MEAVFDALGDATRRRILELLAVGEQPAGALVDGLTVSQPAVSQHLKVLRAAGLVTVRPAGNRRFYAVDPEGLARARAWLRALGDPLAEFGQPLDALETEVARGRRRARGRRSEAA